AQHSSSASTACLPRGSAAGGAGSTSWSICAAPGRRRRRRVIARIGHQTYAGENRRAVTGLDRVEVVHADDHRLGLLVRDQIVHDVVDTSLVEPSRLVFSPAVKQ